MYNLWENNPGYFVEMEKSVSWFAALNKSDVCLDVWYMEWPLILKLTAHLVFEYKTQSKTIKSAAKATAALSADTRKRKD